MPPQNLSIYLTRKRKGTGSKIWIEPIRKTVKNLKPYLIDFKRIIQQIICILTKQFSKKHYPNHNFYWKFSDLHFKTTNVVDWDSECMQNMEKKITRAKNNLSFQVSCANIIICLCFEYRIHTFMYFLVCIL